MLALAACAGDGPCLRHSDCDPGLVCDPVGACVIAPDDAGADGDATLVIDGLPDDGALLDGAPDSAGDAGDDAGRDADAAPDGGVDAGIDHDAG
ncbi:MAG: hypothetical protein KC464_24820 [Myxococcales bacterium]|nr:hypothetical protein [Myxococcales bacterium]